MSYDTIGVKKEREVELRAVEKRLKAESKGISNVNNIFSPVMGAKP